VLHHTGAMWQALENAVRQSPPAAGCSSPFYNTQARFGTPLNKLLKRSYVRSGPTGTSGGCRRFHCRQIARGLVKRHLTLRNPLSRYRNYRTRGMFALARLDRLGRRLSLLKPRRLTRFATSTAARFPASKKLKPTARSGCSQFVLRKAVDSATGQRFVPRTEFWRAAA